MRKTNSKVTAKTLISLMLLVISFIMLVSPWINISVDILGRDYSIPDLQNMVCQWNNMSTTQFEMQMQSNIVEFAADLAEDTGMIIDANQLTKNIKKLMDGRVSLLDLATICTYTSGVLKNAYRTMTLNFSSPVASRAALMTINDIGSALTMVSVIAWLIIAVLVITFVLALYSMLTNKKVGIVAYTCAVAITFVAAIVLVVCANNLLQPYSSYIIEGVEDLFAVEAYSAQEIELFHIAMAPFVGLICAIAATLVNVTTRIKFIQIAPFNDFTKWTCSCGFQNKIGNTFCSSCGQKRPEKPRCECGALIAPEMKFCGKCGKDVGSPGRFERTAGNRDTFSNVEMQSH